MSEQTAIDKTSNDCQKIRVCWGATTCRWVSHARRFEETRCLYFQCRAAQQQRASRPAISDVQVVVPPSAGGESCNCGSSVDVSQCICGAGHVTTLCDAVSVGNRRNNEWRYSSTRWMWQVSFTLRPFHPRGRSPAHTKEDARLRVGRQSNHVAVPTEHSFVTNPWSSSPLTQMPATVADRDLNVLTMVTTMTDVLWDMTPCGMTVYRRFGETCCIHRQSIRTQQIPPKRQ
jgi:hypothetical protein